MGLTSLQVCMDSSSDWLQGGTSNEDSPGMDSSPPPPLSPNDVVLTCSRPLTMERRLRPPHDQAMKCPRCESTHTKFCYYNNYSLTQPRFFCKTCRRYWTKGGTLRNIPVGGGCRKNKTPSSSSSSKKKKQNDIASPVVGQDSAGSSSNTTDLQLSFPDPAQFHHVGSLFGAAHHHLHGSNFLEGIVGNAHREEVNGFDFMGNGDLGTVNLGGGTIGHGLWMEHNFPANICAPFGVSPQLDTNGGFVDTCQRLVMPYGGPGHVDEAGLDVKPSAKLLSLDWQHDPPCSGDRPGNDSSFGYINGLGAWSAMMNSYGPSSTNPLL